MPISAVDKTSTIKESKKSPAAILISGKLANKQPARIKNKLLIISRVEIIVILSSMFFMVLPLKIVFVFGLASTKDDA
jgi:hypothetical protein